MNNNQKLRFLQDCFKIIMKISYYKKLSVSPRFFGSSGLSVLFIEKC